jgi:hypothetical protein
MEAESHGLFGREAEREEVMSELVSLGVKEGIRERIAIAQDGDGLRRERDLLFK